LWKEVDVVPRYVLVVATVLPF